MEIKQTKFNDIYLPLWAASFILGGCDSLGGTPRDVLDSDTDDNGSDSPGRKQKEWSNPVVISDHIQQ